MEGQHHTGDPGMVGQLGSVECQHHAGWQLPRWVSLGVWNVSTMKVGNRQGGSARECGMSAPCRLATAKVGQLGSVECQHHEGRQPPRWVS